MYRDLLFYYGVDLVDVVSGNGPPPILVYELVRGLPNDSMTHALARGGIEYLGWGSDRDILAGIFDSLQVNTVATGNWKKKPPKPETYPRPKKEEKSSGKMTVASLFGKMSARYGKK